MKKVLSFFSFAVLVTAMCVTVTSCSDDDKDDDKGGSSNAKALVGRWMLMQSRGADKTEWSDWNLSVSGAIQFDVNGMYSTYIGGVEMVKGTYVVDGKKIVITYSDNSTQTFELREMSKDKNSMDILLYKSDGTPDTYYRYSRCPKNADEAKQLLMSQWEGANYDPYYCDAEFVDYTKEGKAYWFYHVRKDLPSDYGDMYKYRGKYICWDNVFSIYDVEFTPDKTDPTKGELSWVSSYDKSNGVLTISRLCYQSHYEDNRQFFRVEKPITYEIVEVPEK